MKVKLLKDLLGIKKGAIGMDAGPVVVFPYDDGNGYYPFPADEIKDYPDFFEIVEEETVFKCVRCDCFISGGEKYAIAFLGRGGNVAPLCECCFVQGMRWHKLIHST